MKTLLVIRHAKSNQSFIGADFARPLNERGNRDAPMMAKRLAERNIHIDAFVSSPAERAKKTAEFFSSQYKVLSDEIIFVPQLYHAPAPVFFQTIEALPDNLDSVAIFSHNPGITYFVNELTQVRIDNMPTCGIFAVQAAVESWSEFDTAKKEFLFFDYPKLTDRD